MDVCTSMKVIFVHVGKPIVTTTCYWPFFVRFRRFFSNANHIDNSLTVSVSCGIQSVFISFTKCEHRRQQQQRQQQHKRHQCRRSQNILTTEVNQNCCAKPPHISSTAFIRELLFIGMTVFYPYKLNACSAVLLISKHFTPKNPI